MPLVSLVASALCLVHVARFDVPSARAIVAARRRQWAVRRIDVGGDEGWEGGVVVPVKATGSNSTAAYVAFDDDSKWSAFFLEEEEVADCVWDRGMKLADKKHHFDALRGVAHVDLEVNKLPLLDILAWLGCEDCEEGEL